MTETVDVQRGEYVFGAEDGQLVYSGDGLVHVGPGDDRAAGDRIAASDVADVRTGIDRSVSGFHTIGVTLGLVATLFTGTSAQMFANGAGIDLVSAGTALCAAVGWLAAVQYYRADRGSLRLLVVDTADGEFVFYTQSDGETVDRIADGLRDAGQSSADGPPVPSA